MRRDKRDQRYQRFEEEQAARELAGMTLKVTEFVTASELASMMNVPVTDIIKACFSLGHDGEHQPAPRCRDPLR